MGIKSILNAFGDITVSTIEGNPVLKAQLGNWARSTAFYLVSCFAAQGWINKDNTQFAVAFLVATGLAVYSNLKTRALKRENIALVKTSTTVETGTTLPAEAAKP